MNRECKTAKDRDGETIRVGDHVEAIDIYSNKLSGRVVKIIRIHRQGYDGTILTTEPAPIADFPHHNSHKASMTRKVVLNNQKCT